MAHPCPTYLGVLYYCSPDRVVSRPKRRLQTLLTRIAGNTSNSVNSTTNTPRTGTSGTFPSSTNRTTMASTSTNASRRSTAKLAVFLKFVGKKTDKAALDSYLELYWVGYRCFQVAQRWISEVKTGRRVLVVLMGAFFAAMAARLVVSPIVPYAVATFDTTPGVLGLALSGMWLSYALVQLPAGVLAAQYGTRPLIVAGLLLTAVASGLLAIAPSVLVFAIAVVSLGIGPGLYFPAAAVLLTETSENVGEALGLHLAGGDSAGIVIPLVVTLVAESAGLAGDAPCWFPPCWIDGRHRRRHSPST